MNIADVNTRISMLIPIIISKNINIVNHISNCIVKNENIYNIDQTHKTIFWLPNKILPQILYKYGVSELQIKTISKICMCDVSDFDLNKNIFVDKIDGNMLMSPHCLIKGI
ncbi:hypothetical protein A3Q56_07354, partial [Intoshia linei]